MSWLRGMLGWEAAYGSELQYLLKLPEMHALIRAAPQVGRLLRPLCRMLGVVPDPAILPPPPKRTRRTAPSAPDRRIGPDPAAPVPTEPAAKPMRKASAPHRGAHAKTEVDLPRHGVEEVGRFLAPRADPKTHPFLSLPRHVHIVSISIYSCTE